MTSSHFILSCIDPWKRYTKRHHTRRHKPSVVDFNDHELPTRSDIFASSYDDSGFGTGEFCHTRIPSILDSYDSYRAKVLCNDQNEEESLIKPEEISGMSNKHPNHTSAHGKNHKVTHILSQENS